MTLYAFDRVQVASEKRGPCVACGKKRVRRSTFWATENPWNVNDEGVPRTRREILEMVLEKKVKPWKARPIICRDCAQGTLWLVAFWGGRWTVSPHHDHSAIGNTYWDQRRDSGNCVIYGPSEAEAREKGVALLTAMMQEGAA